jgi:lysyl endopeptidase
MQSKMATRFISVFSGVVFATLFGATAAIAAGSSSAPSVEGEYAKPNAAATKAAAQLPLKGTLDMQSDFASMELPAMDAAKIEAAKKSNSVGGSKKSMQIGISRSMRDELSKSSASPTLRWKSIATGGKVAYLRIKSTDAKAIRVGLNVSGAPDGLELRFVGSNNPNQVVALANAGELSTLKDDQGIYWTPMTEGQFQTIEISLPAGADTAAFKFTVDSVSHIFATPSLKFGDAKITSDCNVDTICAPQTQGFVNAKNSVAFMTFQSDCGNGGATATCICTGTLISDNDPNTQIPYFFGANHCIGTQSVANTLNTYWFFENPTCQNPRTFDVNQSIGTLVTGGAALLFADRNSDGALFQLNRAPPAGAFLLGWDANVINVGENISIIHHPDGDPKRITLGFVDRFRGGIDGLTGSFISPAYTTGSTAGGSSGSSILTQSGGNYFLRGGLYGGPAGCSTSGQPASAGNYDFFSRFDLIFPSIRQFIFKDATAANYTDIWWGGAAESGWGIQITQHPSNNIFATWYTYDQSGNQLFIIMSGCDLIPFNGAACGGRLYRTTGTPFNTPTFAGASVTQIGTGTFTFTDANNAIFDYTIAASASNATTSIRKFITRFPFGAGFATFPSDNSDIYYKSDASGWGYSLAQHGGESFGVIYHYDENRNPMFLTMYMPTFNNTSGGAATLYRTRSNGGSHFLTPTWRSSDISNVPASGSGNASVSVVPGGLNLTFTVNSNGNNFTQIRALTRVPF